MKPESTPLPRSFFIYRPKTKSIVVGEDDYSVPCLPTVITTDSSSEALPYSPAPLELLQSFIKWTVRVGGRTLVARLKRVEGTRGGARDAIILRGTGEQWQTVAKRRKIRVGGGMRKAG